MAIVIEAIKMAYVIWGVFLVPITLAGIYYGFKKIKPLLLRVRQKFAVLVCWIAYPDIYKAYKGGYKLG